MFRLKGNPRERYNQCEECRCGIKVNKVHTKSMHYHAMHPYYPFEWSDKALRCGVCKESMAHFDFLRWHMRRFHKDVYLSRRLEFEQENPDKKLPEAPVKCYKHVSVYKPKGRRAGPITAPSSPENPELALVHEKGPCTLCGCNLAGITFTSHLHIDHLFGDFTIGGNNPVCRVKLEDGSSCNEKFGVNADNTAYQNLVLLLRHVKEKHPDRYSEIVLRKSRHEAVEPDNRATVRSALGAAFIGIGQGYINVGIALLRGEK